VLPLRVPPAIRHPRHRQQCRQHQGVDDREGRIGRRPGAGRGKAGGEGQRCHTRRRGQRDQVGKAGIAPVLLRQAHRQAGRE